MNKKIEEQRFEFALTINGHIVCQRYFSIPYFNETIPSMDDLKHLMDTIAGMNNGEYGGMGIIPKHLKKKSMEYLWKNYNPYYQQKEEAFKNIFEKIDTFEFEIKIDKKTLSKSTFTGNWFPPQIRYQVDIKEIIPNIIFEIKDALSQKKSEPKATKQVV